MTAESGSGRLVISSYALLLRSEQKELEKTSSMTINAGGDPMTDDGGLGMDNFIPQTTQHPNVPEHLSHDEEAVEDEEVAEFAHFTCLDCMECRTAALDDGCGCLSVAEFDTRLRRAGSSPSENCVSNCLDKVQAPQACQKLMCTCDKLANWDETHSTPAPVTTTPWIAPDIKPGNSDFR